MCFGLLTPASRKTSEDADDTVGGDGEAGKCRPLVVGGVAVFFEAKDFLEHARESGEELNAVNARRRFEDQANFFAFALAADGCDFVLMQFDGGAGCFVNGKIEARGEANRAEHAQMIFGKSLARDLRWREEVAPEYPAGHRRNRGLSELSDRGRGRCR